MYVAISISRRSGCQLRISADLILVYRPTSATREDGIGGMASVIEPGSGWTPGCCADAGLKQVTSRKLSVRRIHLRIKVHRESTRLIVCSQRAWCLERIKHCYALARKIVRNSFGVNPLTVLKVLER